MNIKPDKVLHFIAGVLIVQAAFAACKVAGIETKIAFFIAAGIAIAAMAAKEIVWDDMLAKGISSLLDFIAGTIGIAIEIALMLLIGLQ